MVDPSVSAPQKLDAISHVSVALKPGAGKASDSVLEDSGDTDDLTSRRSQAIWGKSRVRDGKSEIPKEAEAIPNIKLGSWNFTKRRSPLSSLPPVPSRQGLVTR